MLTACNKSGADSHAGHDHSEAATSSTETLTNRIAVPEAVRRNLGIRFAKVESRRLESTLRMPGRFETPPTARREYRTPLPGRIEVLVRQYQEITTGTPLYELTSTEWHRLQQEIADAHTRVAEAEAGLQLAEATVLGGGAATNVTQARLEAGLRHIEALRESLAAAEDRVKQLANIGKAVGGVTAELAEARIRATEIKTALAQAEEEKAELQQQWLQLSTGGQGAFATSASLQATLRARQSEVQAARLRLSLARSSARSILQVADHVAVDETTSSGAVPLWQFVDKIVVRATTAGMVDKLEATSGSYAEGAALVLSTVDPNQVRFRAVALQSDLGLLQNGMPARIAPPRGGSVAEEETIPGAIRLGLETDAEERTVDVLVEPQTRADWARPGVTAFVEVVTNDMEDAEPAVPVAAVLQDDLQKILFRRDPNDPDKVIRIEADIGLTDGHWTSILSGLAVGDDVVVEGGYQLKLAGSGKLPEGAHVHADGTVHTGAH